VGETLADVINYPIAGLFVVFLQSSLALAFWFDSVTYLASAALLATMVVPPLVRRGSTEDDAETDEAGESGRAAPEARPSVVDDLKAGWAFLRHETVLLANTLQGTAGQFSLGVLTVASLILAREITPGTGDAYRGTYAFMETAIGVGSLVGGFMLGAIASRAQKGKLVLGLFFGMGVANMAFVIPSQTLFQERTPPELMGRVVSLRFALVFGGMSLAMALAGVAMTVVGPGPVIFAAGIVSVGAGVAGLFVRAVREA